MADLEELDARLLSRAERVVPMRDIYKGDTNPRVIGLRHDVDDNIGSFETALRLAEWEFERGYSATYYLLHGAHYWGEEMLCEAPRFEELGHEVGIHVNALAEALRLGRDPHMLLAEALAELRATGVRVVGCVAHGDSLCHDVGFVNDELFSESPRPVMGAADRMLTYGGYARKIEPLPRHVYGLEYDANWLSRGDYLSDSGGRWSQPFSVVVQRFGESQLHILQHPDWWREAFVTEEVSA
jgi:hypothetical protein